MASGQGGGTSLGIAGVGTPRPVVEEIRRSLLRAVLANGAIHAIYQPIVSLESREVVGFEALARGPRRSVLERPEALIATAEAAGNLVELDWICRGAALKGALAARLDRSFPLLMNVHPTALAAPIPPELVEPMERAISELSVVLELTETALSMAPAALLGVLAAVRERGLGIALDDVSADPRTLAPARLRTLLAVVRPDIIKLNLRLLEQRPEPDVVATLAAVNEQCERTGAAVAVEGIETEGQLATARALGATLGQGFLFGQPDRLPIRLSRPGAPVQLSERPVPAGGTPFEVLAAAGRPRSGDRDLVIALTRLVEGQAMSLARDGLVLGAFPRPELFTSDAQRRWASLAEDALLAMVMGPGMTAQPAPGVQGTRLDPEDPLAAQWSVVVVGPSFAAALAAREQPQPGRDHRLRLDIAFSHDRDLAGAAALCLLRRIPMDASAG